MTEEDRKGACSDHAETCSFMAVAVNRLFPGASKETSNDLLRVSNLLTMAGEKLRGIAARKEV